MQTRNGNEFAEGLQVKLLSLEMLYSSFFFFFLPIVLTLLVDSEVKMWLKFFWVPSQLQRREEKNGEEWGSEEYFLQTS